MTSKSKEGVLGEGELDEKEGVGMMDSFWSCPLTSYSLVGFEVFGYG